MASVKECSYDYEYIQGDKVMTIKSVTALAAVILFAVMFSQMFTQTTYAQSVVVDVTLNPAGSFKAETKQVTGSAYKTADGFAAENIVVDIRNIVTGVSLRDKHTRKHLGVPKYNSVKLLKASGKNGKGEATIMVMDKQQKVTGTYKVKGSMLEAEFQMTLSTLGIKDVAYMGVGVEDTVMVHVTVPVKDAVKTRTVANAKKAKATKAAKNKKNQKERKN